MVTINQRDRLEWKEGMTVRDILDALGYEYSLMTVTVNEKLVPEDEYEILPVPDGAEVTIFHLAHGG